LIALIVLHVLDIIVYIISSCRQFS